MSNSHITHERLKGNRSASGVSDGALSGINGTVANKITIHHRLQVIDGRVRSPISGKFVPVNTIMSAHPELFVHIIPHRNTGVGIEHLLVPSFEILDGTAHTQDWQQLIENLAPTKG